MIDRESRSDGIGNHRTHLPGQAGASEQPAQLPAQHIEKPGLESELELAPRFMAPDYLGSGRLTNKVALITGGDSGMGRAVAVLFAREGANDRDRLPRRARRRRGDPTLRRGRRHALRADAGRVKDPTYCLNAVKRTVEAYGQPDVLVNNAAFQEHADSIEDITEERFDQTLCTNVYGYFRMAKAAVPYLQRGSAILASPVCSGYISGIVLPVTGSVARSDEPAFAGTCRTCGNEGAGGRVGGDASGRAEAGGGGGTRLAESPLPSQQRQRLQST